MSLENHKNKTVIVVLSALIVLGLTSCAAVSNLFGPPEAPPIPKWAYSRKYIKPAGMLPEAIPWAQAFWTNKNRLFVTGRSLDHPSGWARYYARQKGWSLDQVAPLWDPATGKSTPLKARGYEKSQRNAATSQFPDGKLLLSYVTGEFIRKTLHWTHIVYDPDTDTREIASPKPIPHEGVLYSLVSLKEAKYLYVKYEPTFFKWQDKQKPHLLLIEGDVNKNTETVVMDIQTSHHGKLIPTPDKEHFFFVVNRCSDSSGSVSGFGDGYASPCSYIDYIDLKKKTFKTVGSFVGATYKRKDTTTYIEKNNYGEFSIALNQDKLLGLGGKDSHGFDYMPIEVFDRQTGKSEVVGELSFELSHSLWVKPLEGMARFSDGSVAIFGSSFYLYDQQDKKFSKFDDLIVPRGEFGIAISPDDKLYIAGGWPYRGGDARLIEMFDYKAYLKNKKGKG